MASSRKDGLVGEEDAVGILVDAGPAALQPPARPPGLGQSMFPAAGDVDLGVKTTGVLRITVIPFDVGGLVPDTSPSALAGYADAIAAMYPVTSVSLSVGATLTAASPLNWSGMLDQARAQRARDRPYCGISYTMGTSFIVTGAVGDVRRTSRGRERRDLRGLLGLAGHVLDHGVAHDPPVQDRIDEGGGGVAPRHARIGVPPLAEGQPRRQTQRNTHQRGHRGDLSCAP